MTWKLLLLTYAQSHFQLQLCLSVAFESTCISFSDSNFGWNKENLGQNSGLPMEISYTSRFATGLMHKHFSFTKCKLFIEAEFRIAILDLAPVQCKWQTWAISTSGSLLGTKPRGKVCLPWLWGRSKDHVQAFETRISKTKVLAVDDVTTLDPPWSLKWPFWQFDKLHSVSRL